MTYLPRTTELIGKPGVTFANSFVSFSVCCPSRATALSGQYAHNHGVRDNSKAQGGGNDAFDHTETLPVWLQRAGYATGHVGKYLNEYGETSEPVVEPGYDDWFTAVDPSTYSYTDMEFLDNGQRRQVPGYGTDIIRDRAVADIDRFSAGSKPFYLSVWAVAPHAAEKESAAGLGAPGVAPAYASAYPDVTAPRSPAYLEPDRTDKPAATQRLLAEIDAGIAANGKTAADIGVFVDQLARARAQSLSSVDDLVVAVVDALKAKGQLDNTVIVFTSDNGWMFGEHGIVFGKVVAYEESIRVPLLVRGPGFPAGHLANQPVVNVDLSATILDVAQATAGKPQDGTSLRPVAASATLRPDRAVLLESFSSVQAYAGVRTAGWVYIRYAGDGGEELYDLLADPYQLDNRATDPAFARPKARLARALDALEGCVGPACVVTIPGNELR